MSSGSFSWHADDAGGARFLLRTAVAEVPTRLLRRLDLAELVCDDARPSVRSCRPSPPARVTTRERQRVSYALDTALTCPYLRVDMAARLRLSRSSYCSVSIVSYGKPEFRHVRHVFVLARINVRVAYPKYNAQGIRGAYFGHIFAYRM